MKIRSELRRLASTLACLGAASGSACALEMPELMGWLAQSRSGEAQFVEERHVQGFDAPLYARGTLSFTAPDRFVRRTVEPRAETMSVDGNALTLTRNGKSRSLALDSAPELAAIVEAVRGTLSGDGQALQRHFRAAPDGSADQWTLQLTPLEPRVIAQVQHVRIGGRRGEVRKVEVQLADGDRSVMTIEPAATRPRASSP